ncbi:MAG: GGDEF domain-containing protein [Magnetococcales bacterium]|nr:GGDEF domain-containing protein [Magnetococcales bacterium]
MGIIVNLDRKTAERNVRLLMSRSPSSLVEELDHYRRRTEELARIYDLHRRLGEKLDLASMIESFSVWLMPHLDHELVAYRNYHHERMHISCSCHGPQRQKMVDAAYELMNCDQKDEPCQQLGHLGLGAYSLPLDSEEQKDRLILFYEQDEVHVQEERSYPSDEQVQWLLDEVIEELRGPVERALIYEELYDQARRDALTGLVNRRVFDERTQQEMINAQRYGHPLALACLDLDHFKAVNDRLGHQTGDEVLKQVSEALRAAVRDSDVLARTGGDEFTLLLPNTQLPEGLVLMRRLCEAVKDLNIQAPGAKPLGVSIGLACWEQGESMEAWVERADSALYQSKAAGRSQVSVWSEGGGEQLPAPKAATH